ncbi:MAG TPA: EAL domain-containing protein [Conexibacter sp.]|nr:EAL domain-containing protein [Conexibacter sp.]
MEDVAGERPARSAHAPVPHLIDRRGRLRLAYEPVADLARGTICGYEAVERFPEALPPEAWRTEALRRSLEPDFDAFVVGSVLQVRESLPAGCFLSFNVRAATLLREPVRRVLGRAGALDGLVIELAPRVGRRDEVRLAAAVVELRAAGAAFAIDDVGGDDAVLRPAAIVRPDYVKLSSLLVADVHRAPPRLALLGAIVRMASHFGAAIVAQGVAKIDELDALLQSRVPLVQGPLIGVRAKTLTPVAFGLSAYVRERGGAMLEPGALAPLVEPLATLTAATTAAAAFARDPELRWVTLVDEQRRPIGLIERAAFARGEQPSAELLVVSPANGIVETVRRAMLRPPASRFDPLVCCDADGAYAGIVHVERLVEALARAAEQGSDAPLGG